MSKEQFVGIVRHVLGAVGAGVVAVGWVDGDMAAEVTGALMTLAAVGWSVWAKARGKDVGLPPGPLMFLLAAGLLLLPGCAGWKDYDWRFGATFDQGTVDIGADGADVVVDLRSGK